MQKIELKGLSPEQVDRLLPEGLISLCWRGSVAHRMYVPKSDPDSIDDKDVMGVYIGPLEHYLGFGRREVYEAERLFQLSQEAYVRSSLPSEPDRDRAERLCVEMISQYLNPRSPV